MDQLILETAEHILLARRAQVALFVDVDLQIAVDCGAENVRSYVEFASVDQERIVDVFLDDASPPSIRR